MAYKLIERIGWNFYSFPSSYLHATKGTHLYSHTHTLSHQDKLNISYIKINSCINVDIISTVKDG